jgi:hypothetical protein
MGVVLPERRTGGMFASDVGEKSCLVQDLGAVFYPQSYIAKPLSL